MKRFLLAFLLLGLAGVVTAEDDVYNSSNTVTNEANARVTRGRGTLKRIVVGAAGTGSVIQVWDGFSNLSTSSYRVMIGSFTTAAVREIPFDISISSGILYTTIGATPANLTIIYKGVR